MNRPTNPPAFPNYLQMAPQDGMTLRDYIAASVIGHLVIAPFRQDQSTDSDAAYAYRVADAMLKAREA